MAMWVIDHPGMTLAELAGGKLVPYPSKDVNEPSSLGDAQRLISVHGITLDSQGRLWLIDDGKHAGHEGIQPGAAKVVGIDLKTNKIFASVVLKDALLQDSHMNDLRIDLTHGAQGMRYEGSKTVFPHGGVDSLALTPDGSRLYYSPLTSRHLWSLPTASLSDFSLKDAQLAAQIKDEGEKVMTDGMDMDRQGRIYLTDAEHHQILRRWPDGRLEVVLRDPRLVWPDGIFVTEHYVYVTLGQWDRLGKNFDTRRPPYLLVRSPIDSVPQFNAQPE